MPMLRKLPKANRARIESAASEIMRMHGEQAREFARAMSKKARDKHQPRPARYWSLVALALSRINAHDPPAPPTRNKQADIA
jgi:hypothetical protein